MSLTTTPTIEEHLIKQDVGVVSGEVIIDANFIKDFTTELINNRADRIIAKLKELL